MSRNCTLHGWHCAVGNLDGISIRILCSSEPGGKCLSTSNKKLLGYVCFNYIVVENGEPINLSFAVFLAVLVVCCACCLYCVVPLTCCF